LRIDTVDSTIYIFIAIMGNNNYRQIHMGKMMSARLRKIPFFLNPLTK